jgi:TPR repeat protein
MADSEKRERRSLYSLGDPRSIEELQIDAERLTPAEQYILGSKYAFRAFVLTSDKAAAQAIEWYRKAADQGYGPAQFNLGDMYDDPRFYRGLVPQDYIEAAKWYRRAAEQGFAPAQCNLGVMHDKGKGVSQDYAEAVKWYRKAAEQNNRSAQFNLGLKYTQGQGVPKDNIEAARWYRIAAEAGCPDAQFNLGLMHERGQGVAQDLVQAAAWMLLAIDPDAPERKYITSLRRVKGKMSSSQNTEAHRLAVQFVSRVETDDRLEKIRGLSRL